MTTHQPRKKSKKKKRTWNIKHVISNLRAKFYLVITYNHVYKMINMTSHIDANLGASTDLTV